MKLQKKITMLGVALATTGMLAVSNMSSVSAKEEMLNTTVLYYETKGDKFTQLILEYAFLYKNQNNPDAVIDLGKRKIKVSERLKEVPLSEYEKRLGAYIKLNTIEISDEKVKVENDSEIALAMEKEGNNILSKIKDNQYVITLEILGKNLSSEEFSSKIDNLMLTGKSDIALVIGGSYGLSDNVKKRSDFALSFSRMTFPHQMMRVVLLEQVYRAYRIITGASYHK